jgi:hypothetical protein
VVIKITPQEVLEERNKTGQAMMFCKKVVVKRKLLEAISELPYGSVELKQILTMIVKELT